MPSIRNKSNENIKAANLLVNNRLFASSVHCAYYSCFQLSKYILDKFCGMSYNEQDIKTVDSHIYVINSLDKNLLKISHISHLDYLSNMNKLKRFRKKADYTIGIITPKEAQDALASAEKIILILTTKYRMI